MKYIGGLVDWYKHSMQETWYFHERRYTKKMYVYSYFAHDTFKYIL